MKIKHRILLLLTCLAGPAMGAETLDILRAIQFGSSSTNNSVNVFSTALCVANNSTATRDMLVVASFTQGTNTSSGQSATASYKLVHKTGAGNTDSTTGLRNLSGGSDRGNGMLAWIFRNVSGTGICDSSGTRFVLEHADNSNSRTVNTERISLLAIPLKTEENSVPLNSASVTQGDSHTHSTSSTAFTPVTTSAGTMSEVVTIPSISLPRAAYVIATLSSEASTIGSSPAIGEWQLQGSSDSTNGTDGTWTAIGSTIERSITTANAAGMIQLAAVVEGIEASSYYFRLAAKTNNASNTIVTKRAQMAAVSLSFSDGTAGDGYFPVINDAYNDGSECDATNLAIDTMDGVVPAAITAAASCDENTPDPLTDVFTLTQPSDVFMTLTMNAYTFGAGETGEYEAEVWSGVPNSGGTAVFGHSAQGNSMEVERYFNAANSDIASVGQAALWDSGDSGNAQGRYNAYGGWGNAGSAAGMETFSASLSGWVARSLDSPTIATIGRVELNSLAPSAILSDLTASMPVNEDLFNLLVAWDPAVAMHVDQSNRDALLDALRNYLDPDGDQQVAVLFWETLEESGTVGFYVERNEVGSDTFTRINEKLLPGMIDAPHGAEYRLFDPDAKSGTDYQYELIEQEAWGSQRRYGPYHLQLD